MGTPLRLLKPPLITPSASPQPSRFPSRILDRPSPSKKQRRAFQESSPSTNSRTQTPVPNVQNEREASMLRLLGVWGSLAERYSRHMDDDDLVDIRTGEITKDNGVLRNAPTLEFGSLAAPDDAHEEEEEEEEEEEDEYGPDELDAFAEPVSDTDEANHPPGIDVPPATLLNQTYADDLREFLEAEKIRKEHCGTDVEEDSEEEQSIREDAVEDSGDDVDDFIPADRKLGSSDHMEDLDPFSPQDNRYTKDSLECVEGHRGCSEPIVVTSDGDELDFWRADGSQARQAQNDEIDSDIEIIETTNFSLKLAKNTTTPKRRQLHTPPLSHSSHTSSRLSVTPLTTEHIDTAEHSNPIVISDDSGDDSFPSHRYRRKTRLKDRHSHDNFVSSSQSPSSKAHLWANALRDHSPNNRGNSKQFTPVPSPHKGTILKTKQRPIVLLTPRNAPAPLAKHSNGDFDDDLPETSSSPMLSRRKGKEKERDDIVVRTFPDKLSTFRKVGIPVHIEQRPTASLLGESKGANLAGTSPHRSRKRPRSHSLKRKHDSNSTEDVSEVNTEGDSPDRHIASGSQSSSAFYRSSTSGKDSPSAKWDPRTDPEHDDEPVCEQNQRIRRKRSPSRIDSQIPPPHFLFPYAPSNRQNHVSDVFTPIPDPRAQLIIAQAVQQLSALVTGTWQSPNPHCLEGSSPLMPHRRSFSIQPSGSFHATPTHPHMYPHLYDPDFSRATLPPESPAEGYDTTPSRRFRNNRERKVSFQLNEESDIQEISPEAYRTSTSYRRSMTTDCTPSKINFQKDEEPRRKRGPAPGSSGNSREKYK